MKKSSSSCSSSYCVSRTQEASLIPRLAKLFNSSVNSLTRKISILSILPSFREIHRVSFCFLISILFVTDFVPKDYDL